MSEFPEILPFPRLRYESLSPEIREKLEKFKALLIEWNSKINLVSAHDLPYLKERHILDSLQLLPLLPAEDNEGCQAPSLADFGSGAGFPGLILAIASDRPFYLIEKDLRKAAFLQEASRITGAKTTVCAQRSDLLSPFKARLITARALAPLPKLLELTAPFRDEETVCLFPKGENFRTELHEAFKTFSFSAEIFQSSSSPASVILRLSRLCPLSDQGSSHV